jgi:two-component system sensor histidine kinase/response regulator
MSLTHAAAPPRDDAAQMAAIVAAQTEIGTSALDLDAVMDLIARRAQELTGSTGAAVELAEGEEMVYRAAVGSADHCLGLRLAIETSLSGRCVRTASILQCDDSETDPRVNREACRKVQARSMLVVPLFHEGSAIGVLKVLSTRPAAFGERDVYTLQLLASLIAAAVGRAAAFRALSEANAALRREIETRTRVQEELAAANAQLERATNAKSIFLANMSHEIRTPMNGIIGMTELALDTELTEQQRGYLTMVRSAGESLLRIINDILDFSKIEAGKLELDHVPFDLEESQRTMLKTLALRAEAKGLELLYAVEPDVPRALVGDPHRLQQVVMNLIGNAIKFTERGEVELRIAVESLTAAEAELHFAVRDTGIGIPEERQALVFEAFAQAETSTTRRFGGTGLGLAISSQLVQAMGGRIWLESREGAGSTFHFTIRCGLAPVGVSRAPMPDLRGRRALVVDDHASNREILSGLMRRWGMESVAVPDARTALDLLRGETAVRSFDVAVLDGLMPGMDGLALAAAIRQLPGGGELPLLLLSSTRQAGDLQRSRSLGISAALLKPAQPSELFSSLAAAIAGPSRAAAPPPAPTPAAARPLSILLCEDDAINQALAVGVLTRLGHTVTIAGDGRQGVEKARNGRFDLVLMDVQMPEMDGFQATAAIRASEGAGRRLPIVGLTAYAMSGDRERCLAAGMDGYLTKPLRRDELAAALASVTRPTGPEAASTLASPAEPDASDEAVWSVVDRAAFLDQIDGDRDLLDALIDALERNLPLRLQSIRDAVERLDAGALAAAAHQTRGTLATFHARYAVEPAAALERLGQAGNLDGAGALLATLESECARLQAVLPALRGAV